LVGHPYRDFILDIFANIFVLPKFFKDHFVEIFVCRDFIYIFMAWNLPLFLLAFFLSEN